MKKIYRTIISLACLALTFSSCQDWLDLYPSDEIKEEYLFSSGDGFRTALNGIYRKLSTFDLYGSNLTWGIVDAWGQVYDKNRAPTSGSGQAMSKICNFNYKHSELTPTTDAMWNAAWNIIANCNNLIQQAEVADPALFYDHDTERRMILGEAIGLRAYMHFDLLRMYAPAPAANPNTRTFIPYVDKYPSYVNDKQTVSYCLEHAIADLKESQRILFDIDTEWMFGKNRVESLSEQDWCIVKSDSLYMGIAAEETAYSYNEGHVLLSQKLGKNKKDQGVLLFGFNEGKGLQYEGEILHPYWNKDGKRELKDALLFIGDNYKKLMRECDRLDGQLNRRAFQTRIPSFARQMILDYRKFISEHRFVMSQSGDLFCFGDTLANVRESYSNFPILLSLNRMDWMKGLLEPVFEYCENDYWRKSYPPYDIGIYPIANRQVKVDDYAVEMAADMLIMITAIVEAEQDFGYADAHWNLLCLWADYLREKMKKEVYPCGGLLNEDDERVKCVLGLMAYRKLIQLKESV